MLRLLVKVIANLAYVRITPWDQLYLRFCIKPHYTHNLLTFLQKPFQLKVLQAVYCQKHAYECPFIRVVWLYWYTVLLSRPLSYLSLLWTRTVLGYEKMPRQKAQKARAPSTSIVFKKVFSKKAHVESDNSTLWHQWLPSLVGICMKLIRTTGNNLFRTYVSENLYRPNSMQ